MANQKKRKRNQESFQILTVTLMLLVIIALVVGVWLAFSRGNSTEHSGAESGMIAEQTRPDGGVSDASAEVTTTTTETTVVTTTTEPLPPGSVTGISLSFYSAVMNLGDSTIMPLVTMLPEDAADKSELWTTSDEAVATVDDIGRITPVGVGQCIIRVTSVNNPNVFADVALTVQEAAVTTTTLPMSEPPATTATTTADGMRDDITVINGITYVQGVMIVNKTYSLPSTYNPGGLTPEARDAFAELQQAAAEDNLSLYSVSDFRSYEKQVTLYNNYCNRDGKEAADRYSARPGHSEHQTGLTIDVNYAGDAFHDTPEAIWLENNSWKYGFIIRFPRGKEEITGYKYESWHIRYVGKEWAKKIYDSGLCMEEYFNVTSQYAG